MSRIGMITVIAVTAALGGAAARADGDRQVDEARAHFREGQRAYSEGRFADALREFEAGYALSPRPEFLLNFAQTERKLGRVDEAIDQCQRFLAAAPDSPLAPEARRLLQTLREERALAPPPAAPPTVNPLAPPSAAVAPGAAAESVMATRAPPARREAPRRTWIWITAGAVAVVAIALGVGLGVGLSSPRDAYPASPLVVSFGR
ncbi:MAG TPA: tetratricopeptide repeat protein [Polyangia bacterium]|nr:tetratricopeptide repeat protein [Polyangia bacterium]